MQNIPTPDNIVSITYQLLQEVNDPASIRGQMPILSVQFQDSSVVRNKMISFLEMKPYLNYLKARADALGKAVVCYPPTTYDKKIVLEIGDASIVPITGSVIIEQDGAGTALGGGFNAIAGCSIATGNSVDVQNFPCLFEFKLPVVGEGRDFEAEYEIAPNVLEIACGALINGANWDVTLCVFNGAGGISTVDFITNSQAFVAGLTEAGGGANSHILASGWSMVTNGFPAFWNTTDKIFCTVINKATEAVAFSGRITAKTRADGGFDFDLGAPGVFVAATTYIVYVYFVDSVTEQQTQILSYEAVCSGAAVQSANDTRLAELALDVCGAFPVTVYWLAGAFAPGITIYQDPALTIPYTGFNFVSLVSTATIYNIGVLDALVGADTGNAC